MIVAHRSPLLAVALTGLILWASAPVDAATATAVLLPGPLTITSAPATVGFVASARSDDTQTFTTQFGIGVTDATGSTGGWNIRAKLITVARETGLPLPVRQSSITSADVMPESGTAPTSLLTYPRPLETTGDTIFSAARASGMGKSWLIFDAELDMPADSMGSTPFTTALVVTIISGP